MPTIGSTRCSFDTPPFSQAALAVWEIYLEEVVCHVVERVREVPAYGRLYFPVQMALQFLLEIREMVQRPVNVLEGKICLHPVKIIFHLA
jgi:hypothetical protein